MLQNIKVTQKCHTAVHTAYSGSTAALSKDREWRNNDYSNYYSLFRLNSKSELKCAKTPYEITIAFNNHPPFIDVTKDNTIDKHSIEGRNHQHSLILQITRYETDSFPLV